jgi:hypothetical protein
MKANSDIVRQGQSICGTKMQLLDPFLESREEKLPLQVPLKEKAPSEVVQVYVRESNQASYGLHYALKCGASLEVFKYLDQMWPDSLKERDNDGNLPLHRAAAYNPTMEVVEFLYQKWPEAIQEKNNNGDLALHAEAIFNHSLEVVEFLYQTWPDAIQERTFVGAFRCIARPGKLFAESGGISSREVGEGNPGEGHIRAAADKCYGWNQSLAIGGGIPLSEVAGSTPR